MAYGDFDLKTARERFGLSTDENRDLFSHLPAIEPRPGLREILREWAPVAIAMNTEKARSEMIIAPILMEAVSRSEHRVTLFSGISLDVDCERGLTGICDYVLSRSPERYYLMHPIFAIIEAKKEDMVGGLGQCTAAMVAAQAFNLREGTPATTVFGAVTSGNLWRFLMLRGTDLSIDRSEYYLEHVDRILGVLVANMLG